MHHQELSDAALDDELTRTLAVDPSPEFVARIRQRVAAEAGPRAGLNSWAIGLAVAGALVGVAVVFIGLGRAVTRATVAPPLTSRAMELDTSALVGGNVNATLVEVRATLVRAQPERRVSHQALRAEVLVDPREARAIRAFVDGAVSGRVDFTPLWQTLTSPPGEPAPVQDISIAPIELSPLAGDQKGGPQ